jgi:SnoaL-like protein
MHMLRHLWPALHLKRWVMPKGAGATSQPSDPAVSAFLDDYIGLYQAATLPRWLELFLPGAIASAANVDGSVTMWTRDEFYARQQALFASAKPIRETLENTRVERDGRLACVRSDFIWTDGAITRRGRLMLLLIDDHGALKAQALTFSYAQ